MPRVLQKGFLDVRVPVDAKWELCFAADDFLAVVSAPIAHDGQYADENYPETCGEPPSKARRVDDACKDWLHWLSGVLK